MSTSFIVWDIETIPDVKGFATANGHDAKSNDEVRATMGDKLTSGRPAQRTVKDKTVQRNCSRRVYASPLPPMR